MEKFLKIHIKNPENHKLQTQKHKTKQIQIEPEDKLIKKKNKITKV
jgi:hypothetical protein